MRAFACGVKSNTKNLELSTDKFGQNGTLQRSHDQEVRSSSNAPLVDAVSETHGVRVSDAELQIFCSLVAS